MRIQIDASALAETTWRQYAVRFIFGGLVTVLAGILAKQFGPVIGGLFLALPAIFPASATLIEKHQNEKKERAGLKSPKRAAEAVSLDAAGAAIGSIGLAVFAALCGVFCPAIRRLWLSARPPSHGWQFRFCSGTFASGCEGCASPPFKCAPATRHFTLGQFGARSATESTGAQGQRLGSR
jgi:hypothetical protein